MVTEVNQVIAAFDNLYKNGIIMLDTKTDIIMYVNYISIKNTLSPSYVKTSTD